MFITYIRKNVSFLSFNFSLLLALNEEDMHFVSVHILKLMSSFAPWGNHIQLQGNMLHIPRQLLPKHSLLHWYRPSQMPLHQFMTISFRKDQKQIWIRTTASNGKRTRFSWLFLCWLHNHPLMLLWTSFKETSLIQMQDWFPQQFTFIHPWSI